MDLANWFFLAGLGPASAMSSHVEIVNIVLFNNIHLFLMFGHFMPAMCSDISIFRINVNKRTLVLERTRRITIPIAIQEHKCTLDESTTMKTY